MYAVIKTGGKQYRVSQGDRLKIELLGSDVGSDVEFDQVLMVADGDQVQVGADTQNVKVTAKILEHGRGKKISIIKFRRRKHHMKRMGHRQHYTLVEITGIQA